MRPVVLVAAGGILVMVLSAGCGDSGSDSDSYDYPPPPEETANEIRACVDGDCSYRSVEQALASAGDGSVVLIRPGVYRDGGIVRANGVRIEAEGAYLFGAAFEEKASLVIKGDDTVIVGLRCSHIRVPDDNGACVRAEGRNLTLLGVHFHDSQTGMLSGSTEGQILIEDSTFEHLGNRGDEVGNAHGIYVGTTDVFILRRSRVVASVGEGHEVKSRAARTVIEDSVIASLYGTDSRQIDVPNGGDVVVKRNVLEKGPNSTNGDVIAIGMERGLGQGHDHALNRAVIEDNTILIDRRGWWTLVSSRGVPEPRERGNVVVDDRRTSGIDPFPFLPSEPLRTR